jgi:drug/metabolite transporter (DMT)-like permease
LSARSAAGRAATIGVLLSLAGYTSFNLSDTIAKYLTDHLPALELVAAMFVVTLLLSPVLVAPRRLLTLHRLPRLPLLLVRSLCQLASSMCFIYAIAVLPLADVIAIGFVSPFMITGLAALFLHERVGPRRWIACIFGFIGALVILRPGLEVEWGTAVLPLANAFFYSTYCVLTRALGSHHDDRMLLAFNGLVGAPIMLAVMPFVGVWPQGWEWLGLAGIGLLSGLAHLLIIRAYRMAPASLLAPFQYLEIVGITVLAYLAFGEFPDGWTWLGTAIIVSAGLFVFYRETMLARSQAPASESGELGSHP